MKDRPSGLYVHVPFCIRKCNYCSFYSVSADEDIRRRFSNALLSELRTRVKGSVIKTIYAGGGTPTLLPPAFWRDFLTVLTSHSDTSEVEECTIETNPGAVTERELCALRQAGFNRLSIGVQSFDDTLLQTLGRIHSSDQAIETFRSARKAGFNNISLDLMYGIPGQTLKGWLKDLERIEELSPEHVSCYELSVIGGTPIFKSINDGVLSKPAEETCQDMYFAAHEILTRSGYLHYEVSNYARDNNSVSLHNSSYWDRTPYIGLGPSAHSFDGDATRSWNVSSLDQYLEQIRDGHSPTADSELITKAQAALEMVMLGLRCRAGFDLQRIETITGIHINRDYLNTMINSNRVLLSGTRLVPTGEGMLYADGDSVNLI